MKLNHWARYALVYDEYVDILPSIGTWYWKVRNIDVLNKVVTHSTNISTDFIIILLVVCQSFACSLPGLNFCIENGKPKIAFRGICHCQARARARVYGMGFSAHCSVCFCPLLHRRMNWMQICIRHAASECWTESPLHIFIHIDFEVLSCTHSTAELPKCKINWNRMICVLRVSTNRWQAESSISHTPETMSLHIIRMISSLRFETFTFPKLVA